MSRRSNRLSAKTQVAKEISHSVSFEKSTRNANKAKVKHANASAVLDKSNENAVNTIMKSNESYYVSSNEDTSSTDGSGTTIKTTYYNSPGKRKSMFGNDENDIYTTPPKKRIVTNDELDEILSTKTPSALLSQLVLNSPSGKLEDKNCSCRKSLWSSGGIYQDAKQALHSTTPETMPGRQKEFDDLQLFIKAHLKDNKSGSLYISGPPGTGKTACLTLILDKTTKDQRFEKVYVNCTAIKSAGTIYSKIIKELGIQARARKEKEYLTLIETYFSKTRKMIFHIESHHNEWNKDKRSNLFVQPYLVATPHETFALDEHGRKIFNHSGRDIYCYSE